MENDPLHVVRLSRNGREDSGVAPLRLSQTSSRSATAQVLQKRNVVQGSGAVRLSYNQTKLSERAGLQFVEERIVTERKIISPRKVEMQPMPSNFGFSFGHGVFSKVAVLMLVPMLLVYPIVPAYADDGVVASASEEAPQVEQAPAPESAPASEPATETPSVDTTTSETTGTPASTETTSDTTPPTETTDNTSTPEGGDETESGDQGSASTEEASSTPELTATTTDTTGDIITGGESTGGDTSSSTDESTASSTDANTDSGDIDTVSSIDEEVVEEVTEDTPVEEEAVVPESPEAYASRLLSEREGVLRNEIRKQIESEFTKGCVTMDTVGYYCLKDGATNTSGESTTNAGTVTGVQVAPGTKSSYKQIFMTKGGVSTELTSDNWDNAFPTTDVSGKSLVWQGDINGRWQIFFADVSGTGTPNVLQVTHSSESNFNPRVDGKDIVWQGWVDGNWEVYLAEHLDAGSELALDIPLPEENERLGIDRTWRVARITTNNEHDMFPSLSGGLITWQSFQGGTWNVFAYSLKTQSVVKLSRDGAKSEHPRFAITWDERGEDGQTRMMGYDIATGKVIDITGEARQTPNDTKPYQPEAPISQENQAALPISTSTSTSTSSRTDDGDGGGGNGLDI